MKTISFFIFLALLTHSLFASLSGEYSTDLIFIVENYDGEEYYSFDEPSEKLEGEARSMCDCGSFEPFFTFTEVGDCTVEFSGVHGGDPCLEEVGFGWDFDDGFGNLGQNVSFTFPGPGNYPVSLTVTSEDDEECTATFEQVIQITCDVDPGCDCADFDPEIEIVSTSGCVLDLAAVYGGADCVEGVKYEWDLGDGIPVLGPNVSNTFPGSGSYTIALTVFPGNDGDVILDCVKSVELVIEVDCAQTSDCECQSLSPSIQVSDISGCEVDLAGFHGGDDCLSDINYTWDFGDGNTISGEDLSNVSHEYDGADTYNITLTVTAADGQNSCLRTISQQVVITCGVNPVDCDCESFQPSIVIVQNTGCIVSFLGIHGGDPCLDNVKYVWRFGDDTDPMLGEEISHQYSVSGTYTVSLTVSFSDDGIFCRESTEMQVVVECDECSCLRLDPQMAISQVSDCTYNFQGFQDISCFDQLHFEWFVEDENGIEGQNITYEFTESGVYTVHLFVTAFNGDQICEEKIEQEIEVSCDGTPACDIEMSIEVSSDPLAGPTPCLGFHFVPTVSNSEQIFWHRWEAFTADGTFAGAHSFPTPPLEFSRSFSEEGDYSVCLTVRALDDDNVVCESTHCVDLRVSCKPSCKDPNLAQFSIVYSEDGCSVELVNEYESDLDLNPNFTWSFGDGTFAYSSEIGHSPGHTYEESGTYAACLTTVIPAAPGVESCVQEFCLPVELRNCSEPEPEERQAIESMDETNFTVYPNPSSGQVRLQFDAFDKPSEIIVYAINGDIILSKQILNASAGDLDLSHLKSGIYSIKLVQGKKTSIKQIIIN